MLRSPRRSPLRARCHSACSSGCLPSRETRRPRLWKRPLVPKRSLHLLVRGAPLGASPASHCGRSLSLWKEPLTVEGASPASRSPASTPRALKSAPRGGGRASHPVCMRETPRPGARGVSTPLPWHARRPYPEDAPVATGDWRHAMQRRSPRVTAAGRARGACTAEPARAGGRRARGARLRRTLGRPPTSPHRRRGARCRGPCMSGRPTRRGARSRGRSA